MYKIKQLLLISFVTLGTQTCLSQKAITYPAFEIGIPGDILGVSNSHVISISGDVEYAPKPQYHIVNEKSVTEFKLKQSKNDGMFGVIKNQIVYNNFIYLINQEVNRKGETRMTLDKREVPSLKLVNQIELEKKNITGSVATYRKFNFLTDDTGFYVFAPYSQSLFRFDEDGSEIWRKDFSFLKENEININTITNQKNGTLLFNLSLTIKGKKEYVKGREIKRQQTIIIVVKKNEEVIQIAPQFSESLISKHSDYIFDSKKNELIGFFLTLKLDSKNKLKDQGYYYAKWDIEGEEIISNQHTFKFGEIWNERKNPNLKSLKYVNKPNANNNLMPIEETQLSTFLLSNGKTIITLNGMNPHAVVNSFNENDDKLLKNSCFLFLLDESGEIEWSNFIVRLYNYNHSSNLFLLNENNLYLIQTDFESNFRNNEYKFQELKDKYNENEVYVRLKFDLESGDIIQRTKYSHPVEGKYSCTLPSQEKVKNLTLTNSFIVGYHSKKKLTYTKIFFEE